MLTPEIVAAAQASHKKFWPLGPFVSVTLAQFGLESAWGKYASGENNFFGIKANAAQIAAGEFKTVWTKEVIGGRCYSVQQHFANYSSLEACFDAHATLLTQSHYLLCEQAKTPEDYCRALQRCGYATDPNYAEKLIEIIGSANLNRYDQTF